MDLDGLVGHGMAGFRSSATSAVLPSEFTVDGTARTVVLPASVTVSGAETHATAARLGLGPIQAPRYRLQNDLRRGSLLTVLDAMPPSPTPVSVVHPRAEHLSPRLRVFLHWLFVPVRGGAATVETT